jgi:hypothetical protein
LAEPLRVEAPNEDLAQALMSRLHAFPTELQSEGDRVEVLVALVGNADRAIVEILHGVDDWLVENELEAVRVYLDQRAYTLTPPGPIHR